jgi:alkanesulfonate monooxygenase SsuD/methylene tetrahydromethanopterin reductase-like flavin-dependent oxidoreductase (luciferase family)
MSDGRVSLVVPSSLPPERLVEFAQVAEQAGAHRLWVAEDCFFSGGVAAAAAALHATERLAVGCGIFGAVSRHPAILAMEVAALLRAHPGRFTPGVGLGASVWLEQMGIMPAKPLTAVREATTALRELLGGGEITRADATFRFAAVQLASPPDHVPPIYVGVLNQTALECAGEIGDGVLLSVLAGEEYVGEAIRHVSAGAGRRNRPAPPVTAYSLASIADDMETARDSLRGVTAFYLMAGAGSLLTSCLGLDEWIATQLAAGGVDHLASQLSDSLVDRLTIAGTPEQCATRIRSLFRAGVDEVALYLYPSERAAEQVSARFAEICACLDVVGP